MLSFNWANEEIRSAELLQIFASIVNGLQMSHLYTVPTLTRYGSEKYFALCSNPYRTYDIKAIVCFVGAHYLVFIRRPPAQARFTKAQWLLFNDTKVQPFDSWY